MSPDGVGVARRWLVLTTLNPDLSGGRSGVGPPGLLGRGVVSYPTADPVDACGNCPHRWRCSLRTGILWPKEPRVSTRVPDGDVSLAT